MVVLMNVIFWQSRGFVGMRKGYQNLQLHRQE